MNRRPILVIGAAVVAAMTLVSVWAWFQLPAGAQVPIHFGVLGTPNQFADKTIGLFLLPVITAIVFVVVVIVPNIEPRWANLARSGPAYTAVISAVLGLLLVVHLVAISDALGSSLNIGPPVFIGVGVMFVVMGNFLPKVRSNFLFGIRTPWTLSSERSWNRTHRLGGRLFALLGLIVIATVLLAPETVVVVVLVAGLIVITGVLFAYSYVVWRDDPARQSGPESAN